jgi:hypothetical protein
MFTLGTLFYIMKTTNELLPIISKYVRQKRESNANSLHTFLYRTIRDLIQAQNNTTKLESGLIWNTITESLQGNAIQNKPQSYESVEFGITDSKRHFWCKKVKKTWRRQKARV